MELALAQALQETPTANGFAVIITNDYEYNLSKLPVLQGIHTDGETMSSAFKKLNIVTHWERNANKTKLEDIVKQTVAYFESNPPNPEHFKCIAFVFSGHGAEDDVLFMQDGIEVHLKDDIVMPIVGMCIPTSIPKLFFIDACRGTRPTAASGPLNYMVSYATMPKHQAFMHLDSDGDTFLQALASGLSEQDSVQNIVDNVAKKLSKKYHHMEWASKLQQPERNCVCLLGAVYLSGKPSESLDPGEMCDSRTESHSGKHRYL